MESGSKSASFLCRGAWQVDLFFRVGIEIDLTSVLGSKLTSFRARDRKLLVFSVWTEVDNLFCAGVKINFVSMCGSKTTYYCEHGN